MIGRLRRKLGANASAAIETVRGFGYRFRRAAADER
jgi:DNA-binding response OmpR family regulator